MTSRTMVDFLDKYSTKVMLHSAEEGYKAEYFNKWKPRAFEPAGEINPEAKGQEEATPLVRSIEEAIHATSSTP